MSTNLEHICVGVLSVFHYNRLTPAECVGYGVLAGVEDGLAAVWCLDHVVLGAPDPVGGRPAVQDELAAAATALARGEVPVVSDGRKVTSVEWTLV